MKYIILIPIYNDRESLKLLVENINSEIKNLNHEISLVVINDASSQLHMLRGQGCSFHRGAKGDVWYV